VGRLTLSSHLNDWSFLWMVTSGTEELGSRVVKHRSGIVPFGLQSLKQIESGIERQTASYVAMAGM
jgi:hypothetical protein